MGLYISKSDKKFLAMSGGCAIFALIAVILALIGWLKHIFYCFAHHDMVFLIVGAVLAPIGVMHGWWLILTGGN